MDLGATVCTRRNPQCGACPVKGMCIAQQTDQVSALPTPKPRKVLPQRRTLMLVLQRAGEILLEKRPATGIWGGLWCFPEEDAGADVVAACTRRYGARVELGELLPTIAHGFTHFKLDILPQPVTVAAWPLRAEEPGCLWISPDDALRAAVPTPVRAILEQLIGNRRGTDR